MKIPNETEAQSGVFAPQSIHDIFPGILRSSVKSSGLIIVYNDDDDDDDDVVVEAVMVGE
jgi:hypothetical protein